MPCIIGLDPGLASTGWGVVDTSKGGLRYLAHGCIETVAGLSLDARLLIIAQVIAEIIQTWNPVAASVESLFFAKNSSSAMQVAHARGVLYCELARYGVAVHEFGPGKIKMSVLGSGRAEKNQVQAMVKILLGLKAIPEPDHAADALAAAICLAHNGGIVHV